MIDINPLNIFGVRKVHYNPPHFAKVKISDFELHDKKIEQWIEKKLQSRYFISKLPTIIDNSLRSQTYIGFEDHSELSYFLLSCPYLRRN